MIIPARNARDLAELPVEVRDGLTFHPVRTMDEVLAVALAEFSSRRHSLATASTVALAQSVRVAGCWWRISIQT